jgi:hypothetical protein
MPTSCTAIVQQLNSPPEESLGFVSLLDFSRLLYWHRTCLIEVGLGAKFSTMGLSNETRTRQINIRNGGAFSQDLAHEFSGLFLVRH